MEKSVGKQHFQCCPSSLGNISYIPQWEWWDGWKLLEVITIPSEMQVALSLLSKIQDSRFKSIYSTMYRHQSYKTMEQCEKTNQNISWWVHVWRPSLRPYGRYHKGHQKIFGSTGRISAWCYVTKRPGGCCSNPHIFMDRRVFLQGAFYLFPHKLLLFVWVRSTGVQCSETIMVWEACSMDYAVSITVTPTVFLLSSGQCTNHSCMHRH